MNNAKANATQSLFDEISERCRDLRLALWCCDANGQIIAGPTAPQDAQPWLCAPLMTSWVEKTASQAWGNAKPCPVSLYSDCWLLPIPEFRGRRQQSLMLAMLMGPGAIEASEFEQVTNSAQIDAEEARRGVDELIHKDGISPDMMGKMLHWFCHDLAQANEDHIALDEFSNSLAQAYEETNLMYRLARLMNVTSDPVQSIATTSGQMHAIMPMGWIAAAFRADSSVGTLARQIIMAGQPPCSKEQFEDIVQRMINELSTDSWTNLLVPGKDELADLVGAEVIAEPITHDGRVIGALLSGNKGGPDPDVSSVETQFFDAAADFMGVFHQNIARFEEQRAMFLGTLKGLTAAIDAKDQYTCGHSERVAWLGVELARSLGWTEEQLEVVHVAGLVHDVGKIGVPESVLCKPSRLTDEEFDIIKQHPITGYEILKDIPPLQPMLAGVRHHHERWDGRGYPDNLAGEDIPMLGRLLAYADAFDAMSSNRAYRSAMPREKVLAEFEKCAGSQFDPALIDNFLNLDFDSFDTMLERHRSQDSHIAA